ncbi:MAG: protein kinase [Desulforhopalus sp.]|nr:protein kinase [Desulforhopalus sp.]
MQMREQKLNCWEFKKCGREKNGRNVQEMGICPAALDDSFDGINSGINGGRICWAVAGTFCEGTTQGAFHAKRQSCVKCDFFSFVSHQEGASGTPTKLLRLLTDTRDDSFLGELTYRWVKAGERFLVQGGVEDTAYIIQQGTCLAVVEKDGCLHPAGHWSRGDIVGIRGLFTGEPRQSHVEAETDMQLWVLNKHQIDNISHNNPELLSLVTEIVASQFDSKRPVADRRIGKYIATDIIGRGAYSIVYKAVHKDLQMVVAIKMMRHNMVIDSAFLQNFRKEAQIIASLNHENILRVYDFEERYKTVFIVTEYLHGESLRSLLGRLGRIPQLLAIQYLQQICAGLSYAHAKNIIHRDINPDNIMVLPDDRIKILDFGLACPVGTEDEQIGGTLAYQAPELLEEGWADRCSDIYALGITAFELITGQLPFTTDEILTIFQENGQRVLPDPADLLPEIPPELRRIIVKACQHMRKDRYQDIAEVLDDLAPLYNQHVVALPSRTKQQESATIICRYSRKKREDLDRILLEFIRLSEELDIEIQVFKTDEQTGST